MSNKVKILVSDKLAQEGVEILNADPNVEVTVKTGMNEDELCQFIPEYSGLIIRSATKVTEKVIMAAKNLKVVARAGVGVDNVDIKAASKNGIVVMNAPGGNSVSTAEHAISMMLSLSRHIPQASQSMKEGRWEKKLFMGSQITGKTLGVVGLGRIGKEVAKRAVGLNMNVIGFDPYISKEKLSHLDIQVVSIDEILSRADYITVHTPLTEQTKGLINGQNLDKLKDGVRVINCARGGIYEEEALLQGLESGKIAGVALDVFTSEPPKNLTIVNHPKCICTPHLGASTDEAQVSVALETVEEVLDFFRSGTAKNSLNFPTIDPSDMQFLKPWFSLSERMGQLLAKFSGGSLPKSINMQFRGNFEDKDLSPLKAGFTKGLLDPILGVPTNYINAPMYAKDHSVQIGLDVEPASSQDEYTHILQITTQVNGKDFLLHGTIINKIPHVVNINDYIVEIRLDGIVLLVQNRDIPNMVGMVGSFIGSKGINIARLDLSRQEKGSDVYMAIILDSAMNSDDMATLKSKGGILDVFQLEFV